MQHSANLANTNAYQKIVWLDVTMNIGSGVHEFQPRNHLIGYHQYRFQRKLLAAIDKQIFQRLPQLIHHKDPETSLLPKPFDRRNTP